jgi:hypothetical protein
LHKATAAGKTCRAIKNPKSDRTKTRGAEMQIRMRLIGAFRVDRFKETVAEYPEGCQVVEIVSQLQIPTRALGVILINGLHARIDDTLHDGDTLVLLPLLGGG